VPRRTLLPTDRNSLGDEPFCQSCPGVHWGAGHPRPQRRIV